MKKVEHLLNVEDKHIVRVFVSEDVQQVDIVEIQGKLVVNDDALRDIGKENMFCRKYNNININNINNNINISANNIFLPLGSISMEESNKLNLKESILSANKNEKKEKTKCTMSIGESIRVNGTVSTEKENDKILLLIRKIETNNDNNSSRNDHVAANSDNHIKESKENNNVELFADWLNRNREFVTLNACFDVNDNRNKLSNQSNNYEYKRARDETTHNEFDNNSNNDEVQYTDYELVGLVNRHFHFNSKPMRVLPKR